MDSSVSGKDEIWFLRVFHQVPHELYLLYFLDDCLFSWLEQPNRDMQLYLLMMDLDTPETCRV